MRNLDRAQYLSRDELHSLQSAKLRSIVRHAFENVAFYRKKFDAAGLTPDDIRETGDLAKIPITNKKDIQAALPGELLSRGIDPAKCIVKNTSGSTGTPLRFFVNARERDFQRLLNLRIFLAGGFRLTDKTAYIINPHRFPDGKYWFQDYGILRRYYLSVFDSAEKHADALRRIRPDIVYGYPSNLTLLALAIKEGGIADIRPKAVFSSAEALEKQPRALIEAAMKTKVYDVLGLVETGDIAWECPAKEGYHVNSDAVAMEFLDESDRPVAPGERGRLVCTNLYTYTMPLIRYEAGDICVPSGGTCSCGRTLPLMESIKGRANDFIVLPDGKIVASCFLVILMQSFHEVAQYRVIQERRESIVMQIVKGERFSESTPGRIAEEVGRITGNRLKVEMAFLDALPRDASGKIRTVMSKVVPGLQSRILDYAGGGE
ncbi:MAG: phenylacetate--CoA ligase family protein [Deltaproteobacteria bacterium]|nr:phenylacetate--CoA ligase family protein [Deltaproteobacteria bacterium]